MQRPAALPASDTTEMLSTAAAFTAGLLFGLRPRQSSTQRTIITVSAAALAGLAVMRPSGNAVRKAGKSRRASRLRFSVIIPRPVEQVFALCADFENYPRLIHRLRRVVDYGDGRSHWCATTPGGGTIEWDALTTKYVTNSVIAWQSGPGADVMMKGVLRFAPDGDGTCVRISVEYEVKSSNLRDSIAAILAPRHGPKLEKEIRALASRMADAPTVLAKELPSVVSGVGS